MEKSKIAEYCKTLRETRGLNRKALLVKVPQINLVSDPARDLEPLFNPKIALSRGYQAYLPTGLQCLADVIEKGPYGVEVKILDMNYELLRRVHENPGYNFFNWKEIIAEPLESYRPSIVGVSNAFTSEYPNFLEVLKVIRSSKVNPIIIAGGQNATYEPRNLLEQGLCDFVCQREGENKISFLFDQLYQTKDSEEVSGIQFKIGEGVEATTGPRSIVIPQGNLISQHKKLPITDYSRVGTLGPFSRMAGENILSAPIVFNRGCRGDCSFCTVRDYMGVGVRGRGVDDVLDEIDYYLGQGIQHIEFLDDDLTKDKKRLNGFLEGLAKRSLSWSAQNGLIAYDLSEGILEKMRDSGCVGFKVGVESGNQEILRKIKKPATLDSFRRFAKRMQKFPELFTSFNFILGFPNETFGQIMDSFNFSGELNPDWCSYSIYIPLGTEKRPEDASRNFIPSKADRAMEVRTAEKISKGYKVFSLDPNKVPSGDQLKEIWFTLNMQRNFVGNKHLQSNGNPEKLARWMAVLQKSYPLNADFPFFLSLAYQLLGDSEKAKASLQETKKNLDIYWQERFKQFNLLDIVDNFPKNPHETRRTIDSLVESH